MLSQKITKKKPSKVLIFWFQICVLQDFEGDEEFWLQLTTTEGGSVLGEHTVTSFIIQENDFPVEFRGKCGVSALIY